MLKRGAKQGSKGNQATIANSVSKFELLEAFQGHTDLVEFFVNRIWSEERVRRVKTLSLESIVLKKEKAVDSENKARLDELRKKRDELKKVLKEKSANVMRLQAGIKLKRDEELSQQDDPVIQEYKHGTYLIAPKISEGDIKRMSSGKRVTIDPDIVSTYEGQRSTLPARRSSIAGTASKVSYRFFLVMPNINR